MYLKVFYFKGLMVLYMDRKRNPKEQGHGVSKRVLEDDECFFSKGTCKEREWQWNIETERSNSPAPFSDSSALPNDHRRNTTIHASLRGDCLLLLLPSSATVEPYCWHSTFPLRLLIQLTRHFVRPLYYTSVCKSTCSHSL